MSTLSRPRTRHDDLADRLTRATAGAVKIEYAPDVTVDGDPGAAGHQWRLELSVAAEEEIGLSESWLDGRDGPVQPQVVATVRQWAAQLSALADRLEGRQPHTGDVEPSESILDVDDASLEDSAIRLPRNPLNGGPRQ